MQIWMIRDVRIYVSGVQFDDGPLSEHRRDVRAEQLQQIAAALECLELEPPGRLLDETEAPAYDLPRGLTKNDRHIVSEALRFRCDVLLTRDDDDILKRREALMALGLAALRPTEWLDAMAQGDQFGVQGCAHGLIFPDSHKWLHLDAARVAATTDK